jgi:glycosyltransferase involved in cell wall biosynthesis
MQKELWIFTTRFPFGNGESFMENELPILARRFKRIKLFPLMPIGEQRPLPPNVTVEKVFSHSDVFRPMSLPMLLTQLSRLRHIWRAILSSAPSQAVYRKHRRELFSLVRQAFQRERTFRRYTAAAYDPQNVLLYSYWTGDWATILGLWKLSDRRVHFVSRMMGYDLFDHRAEDGWQSFQAFHVQQVDHVFTIARAGLEHMQERYPEHRSKFSVSYLATVDHGPGPWAPAPGLRMVSCANLVSLKRVHLIAQALKDVPGPVTWTHFGDGEERTRLDALVHDLPTRVHVELKGACPNAEILAWYRREPADVFVHVSETEGGVPVALQEAASFGIPLLAADAGGVSEIITDGTGVLLPNDLKPEALAAALEGFKDHVRWNDDARAGVRAFWAANFQAENIHGRFCDRLIELHQAWYKSST